MEFPLKGADGRFRWFLTRVEPLWDVDGQISLWFGTNTDIEDQRRIAEERARLFEAERVARIEAERASRMKDEFLANLSHELRTPLNAILGWSQILASGSRNDADLSEGLQTIERNARAQTQIIEDLLDMSRIISGKVRLDVQRVDLAAVVREAVATARPSADAKGIRLQAVLDPLAGPVSGDPARLQQVMWNLLSNAIKFTPKGGRVQVVLERVNSHVEVSVIDTGEGIDPEFLPHVFDRFRQADATTTRRHGGLGLGLSIVKQLVELHGGSVRVKSAGVGQGATFTVSLPLTVIHPEPDPEGERRHPRAASSAVALPDGCVEIAGVKVLVVDDEPDARALVKRLLEECKAHVITAASAAEALQLVRAERPDVLVCDIGMPGEDGYALIRQVRALGAENSGTVPSAALTAYARPEDRVKAVLAGFQMHLAKPVEPAELIATVASLAGRTR
jgi:signal transduction histidine kinase/ActR/RegA family two-component response regulator